MKLIICANICFLICTYVSFTEAFVLNELGSHSIIQGDCANAPDTDRVFYDHVYKNAIPLYVRSETEKYEGSGLIYCIKADNQKSVETGGNAYIKKGGVDYSYVTIELESKRGHGLDFYVSVYVKNGNHANSPMALASEKP